MESQEFVAEANQSMVFTRIDCVLCNTILMGYKLVDVKFWTTRFLCPVIRDNSLLSATGRFHALPVKHFNT
jgi:hypothetical protein